MFKKLLVCLVFLGLMGCGEVGFAEGTETVAGTGTLTHWGFSTTRMPDKTIGKSIQVCGSLEPSIDGELLPYTAWKQRTYGYLALTIQNDYGIGAGYYLGRNGRVGVQVGFQNNKDLGKDEFIYGLYFDFNLAKFMVQQLAGIMK